MAYDFDRLIERRGTNSIKWQHFPEDVLPLWVADMDFRAPEPILEVLRAKVDHGILGYEMPSKQLLETVAARMEKLYGWQVSPDWIVATPGIVTGFTLAARAVCTPGQGVLVQPPVYPPFLKVHEGPGLVRQDASLAVQREGPVIRYSIDFDATRAALGSGGVPTGMFLLCNPHNPTGQACSRPDLTRLAELCLEKEVVLCSDEIHSELLLGGTRHIPIAALDAQVAARTITLIAPSKTFNIPGLFCGFAIVPDPELLKRYKLAAEQLAAHVNSLGLAAAQAAFSGQCDDWLAALRVYLTANRDYLAGRLKSDFPGLGFTLPDATYLAWLDCRTLAQSSRMGASPYEFFLQQAKVGLNNGAEFGPGGEGFVRLNFGCPRATLAEALDRMKAALSA